MDETAANVRHNPQQQRFEAATGDGLAKADYERQGDRLVFTHTEVPPAARGQGIGDELARAGMDYARAEGLRVVSRCPFIDSWLRRHPEYEDLRAD